MLPDGLAEGLALLGVADGVLHRGLGDAEGTGRDLYPTHFETAHHLGEPGAFVLAEHVVGGDDDVVEDQFAGLDALVAELRQVAGDGVAVIGLDKHDADASVRRLCVQIGLAQQGHHSRAPRVGYPGLGPADPEGRPVAFRDGGHGLQVGATARFGQRHGGPDFTGRELRKVALLLLGCAEVPQEVHDDGVAAHGAGQAHPPA